jgi:hypothetical protein
MEEENSLKICPLSFASSREGLERCREKGCAWYSEDQGRCAIVCIASLAYRSKE